MRVTSVSLLANDEQTLQFDLRNVNAQSQYVVRTIIGLDADEIVPRFYGFSKDGVKRFYDFRLKQREIIMRVVMNPRFNLNETHSDIRDELYRAISATRSGLLQLQFYAGASVVAQISGHMTKLEVPYFSKTPELQLTIRCGDPIFRGINPVIMEPEDLEEENPIIIADSLSTAPHGFETQVTFTATTPTFTIQNTETDPEWDFKITPPSSFLAGDTLHIGSGFTNRYLYMVRGGVTTHLLDLVDPGSVWPTIFPGFNEFHFADIDNFDWNFIKFYAAYWGV